MLVFQAKEIIELTKITRNRFDYIVKNIRIEADIKKAGGRGATNLYSFKALFSFAISEAVLWSGWDYKKAKGILNNLYEIEKDDKTEFFNFNIDTTCFIILRTHFEKWCFWYDFKVPSDGSELIRTGLDSSESLKDLNPHIEMKINIGQIKKDLKKAIKG